ncbi:hypothetical protein BCR36DRAFT_150195 [Piromyces finnis]|uniref:EGF-like domain-containing protein n=1 Tax=Piromyces finnis TaxID=1754191 RepID=A0A1Y1UYX4_9FUNG|nr:hypothetical protein BCR36DRAFT_150195 [Piromyces finnis]|eukprot:ORX42861.1 hypothetical protein BCR36DRAFT_150195 [Piromyces finnis]
MKNSYFDNNKGLFFLQNSSITFDNCYFSKIFEILNGTYKYVFIFSRNGNQEIYINNSIFENIHNTLPLIFGKGLELQIKNTTFSNCYSNYGYLINISQQYKNELKIKNSRFSDTCTIFHGNNFNFDISNTIFENITFKNSLPAIIDSKFSEISISNTTFRNMNIMSKLFNEDSKYILNGIKLYNITTNSKALLHFLYKDISINHIDIENVFCVGDSGDTSLILYDSGEKEKVFDINDMNINVAYSNGPLIKLLGKNTNIILKDIKIENTHSFGSIIDNDSDNLKITISNSLFSNNNNENKINCGNIHFKNDLDITIFDTKFLNNNSKNYGGVMCINDISRMTLNLTSNEFSENSAIDGGALYITHRKNENDNELIHFIINNNTFYNNSAEYFGGAIFMELNNLSIKSTQKNIMEHNKSKILGGGLFLSNYYNKDVYDMFLFKDNFSNSIRNDYSSKPAYIALSSNYTNSFVELFSGDYLALEFALYDEFENIIEDITKFYSSMTIRVTLEEKNVISKRSTNILNYYLEGNIGSFLNGRCEMKNLRIYANPNQYKLKLNIENYDKEIKLKSDITIKINNCSKDHVKMKKNNVIYCETPKCKSTCPIYHSATCQSYSDEPVNVNDVNLNICKCNKGWSGDLCNIKIFIDFR